MTDQRVCIDCGDEIAAERIRCVDCSEIIDEERAEDPREYEAEADPRKYDQGGDDDE